MARAYKEIIITYSGDGVTIERRTPTTDGRPLILYESKDNPRIPEHIAVMWFNHATFSVIDKTAED